MAENINKYSQDFFVHFNVSDQKLTIEEFYQTAKTVQNLTDIFNQLFFDSAPTFAVYVRPPRNGSFIETFIISAVGSATVWVLKEIFKEYFSGFFDELAGKELNNLGIKHAQIIKNFLSSDLHSTKADIQSVVAITTDAVRSFLSQDIHNKKLKQISRHLPIEATITKNQFYTTCANSQQIKGVGFTEQDFFPIKKEKFMNYVIATPLDMDYIETRYELQEITIVSPVNVEESDVKWRGEDKNTHQKITFAMHDKNFREKFLQGAFPLKQTKRDDEMLVYIAYRTTFYPNKKPQTTKEAIKVFRFNNQILDKVPTGIKLNIQNLTINPQQGELFDNKTYEKPIS